MIQLVMFQGPQGPQTGLLTDGKVYTSGRYQQMQEVLQDWANADSRLDELAAKLMDRAPVSAPSLLAPLPDPRNIYFAGANYKDHVLEMKARLGMPLDEDPKGQGLKPWFSIKATGSSVVGPDAQIKAPSGTAMLDWELELAVVIGRVAKDIPVSEALDCVAGYTVVNDLSARDHIARAGVANESPFKWDWIGQKSFDGSCPMGPAITPSRYVRDPMDLGMKLWVNDELMQDSNTGQMLYTIQDQIAHLSSRITLLPGDVILTGTPAGVGMARNKFLKPGDVVRQWIQDIGEFSFTVAA